MNIVVTGHNGYIGSVLVPLLIEAGHRVTGLDTDFYTEGAFSDDIAAIPAIRADIRDINAADLRRFDAVMHLAALSNDPLGDLDPDCTYDINHRGSVRSPSAPRRRASRASSSRRRAASTGWPATSS